MFLQTNSSLGLNNQLSNCANDINEWFISNNLLIMTSKTTLLYISPSPTYFHPFITADIVISPSYNAPNLGVLFDHTSFSYFCHHFICKLSPLSTRKKNQLLYVLLQRWL